MTFCRQGLNKRVAFRLGCVFFVGILFVPIAHVSVSAEVVQAFRKPSEADLQWLFDGQPMPLLGYSSVVQMGLQSHCEPCKPVGLPTPPIPPAPNVISNIPPTGIAPPLESAVVQMAGKRLPPPPNLPKERNELPLQPPEPIIERLPMPPKQDFFDHTKHTAVVQNEEDLTCQSYRKRENIFSVPNMVGGHTWLADTKISTGTGQWVFPTMLLSRPNVIEHFNAESQNRIWIDFRLWNHAVSINQNNNLQHKAVEQFTFGLETEIFDDTSLELRVPLLGQFESDQNSDNATLVELGNISVYLKQVLKRSAHWTLSTGVGISLPTADDWHIDQGRFKNRTYHLVSYLGVQWHPNRKTFGHFVVQADMPIEKNKWFGNSNAIEIEGQQMIRTGLQLGRWLYRNDSGNLPCRLGSFAEIDYAVVTDGMAEWGLTQDKSSLTTALGLSVIFGKLICTNSVNLPISGDGDPYSIGYNFSLSRQF